MNVMLEDFKTVALHCRLPDGSQQLVTFVPGKNQIDKKIWQALVESNADTFEAHYQHVLHPFKSKLKTGCRDHLFDYSEEEMIEIVENVHSVRFCQYLLHMERERRIEYAPRKRVIDALLAKIPVEKIDLEELARIGAASVNR